MVGSTATKGTDMDAIYTDESQDWLVERLQNLAADARNGEPIDFALEASEIRRYSALDA